MRRVVTTLTALLFALVSVHSRTTVVINRRAAAAAGGGGASTVTADTFTRADASLGGSTASGGGTWVSRESVNTDMVVASNKARCNGSFGDIGAFYINVSPTNADYSVEATLVSSQDSSSLAIRVASGTGDAIFVRWNSGAGEWELYQNSGGVGSLGTYAGDDPSGGKLVKLVTSGTNIKVYLGGVERISATTAVTGAGFGGFYNYFAGTSNTWDDLTVYDD